MDKKEYITNQLRRAVHKKYENYCITRIIHRLDNLDVQFITQQLFRRPDGKFAYADLYFPQLNISVEIDESHHLAQEEADKKRTEDIKKADEEIRKKYTGLEDIVLDQIEEYRISANHTNTIEEINSSTDEIVDIINTKIEKMGDAFVPWKNVYEDASYYFDKGSIDKSDNAKFRTIDDIGKLFNMDKVPMGYKVHGYVPVGVEGEYFWCPTLKLSEDEEITNRAENTISNNGEYIYEYFKEDNDKEIEKALALRTKRYVFGKYKDAIGKTSYKFMGVYALDEKKTKSKKVRTWKRVGTAIEF